MISILRNYYEKKMVNVKATNVNIPGFFSLADMFIPPKAVCFGNFIISTCCTHVSLLVRFHYNK